MIRVHLVGCKTLPYIYALTLGQCAEHINELKGRHQFDGVTFEVVDP